MKIIHFISSLSRGGKERQLLTIYKNNFKQEHEIKILFINNRNPNYLDEFEINNNELLKVTSGKFIKRVIETYRIFKREKPRVIYAWGILEVVICLIIKPFLNFIFINGSVRHGILSRKSSKYIRLLLLHLSQNVVANSKAGLRANYLKKGYVLYNGISEKFFNTEIKSQEVAELRYTIKSPVLISVANLVPYKDYFTVINALVQIKQKGYNFTYFIVGDGPMKKEIISSVEFSGLSENVRIIGSKDNVEEWLAISDLFIHSSKGEGCSNSILEAMAAGLPILATNVGGIPEVVEPDFGFLFEYKKPDELAFQLERLLSDLVMLEKMGKTSKDRALDKFSLDAMMKRYYQIVEDIVLRYHN